MQRLPFTITFNTDGTAMVEIRMRGSDEPIPNEKCSLDDVSVRAEIASAETRDELNAAACKKILEVLRYATARFEKLCSGEIKIE